MFMREVLLIPFVSFFFLFICVILYFYFCRNGYCLRDVNIFVNAKHKQSQNGSLNYLDFFSEYMLSVKSVPRLNLIYQG